MFAAVVFCTTAIAADITGAGATFPYPMYAKWAEGYKKATGVGLNYQSIGSSGGIRQINARTVTFGATDAPVSGADLDKNAQIQFPAIRYTVQMAQVPHSTGLITCQQSVKSGLARSARALR